MQNPDEKQRRTQRNLLTADGLRERGDEERRRAKEWRIKFILHPSDFILSAKAPAAPQL
jgi:hypothetical protein